MMLVLNIIVLALLKDAVQNYPIEVNAVCVSIIQVLRGYEKITSFKTEIYVENFTI